MSRTIAMLVVVVATAAGPARAQQGSTLDRATAAIDAVDYPGAARLIDQALATGRLSIADVARAWRLKGVVEASLGNADAATAAFVELLSADPSSSLPEGLPPRVVSAFEAAQAEAEPVRVECKIDQARRLLTVELHAGSSKRASYVRIERTVGDSPVQRNRVTAPVRLALPDQPARYACFAVDEQGNEWATGPGRDAPLTWAAPATAATAASADSPMGPATGRPLWRNPWIWGSAAGATLATGVVFGLLARSDRNEFDDLAATSGEVEFTAAEEVLDRGKSRATIANVLFATGGALAIATAVFIWTAPADHERTGVSAIGVGPGGLTISGSF